MPNEKPIEVHTYKLMWEGFVNGERYVKDREVEAVTAEVAKGICKKDFKSGERIIFISSDVPEFGGEYHKKIEYEESLVSVAGSFEEEDWFKNLIEEAGSTIVEAIFSSNWIVIEGYHTLGKLVEESRSKFASRGVTNPVPVVAKYIKKSSRTVYRAVQFYNAYPNLDLLPEGKNTSWHKIVNKCLVKGEDKPKQKFVTVKVLAEDFDLILHALQALHVETVTSDTDEQRSLELLNLLREKKGN